MSAHNVLEGNLIATNALREPPLPPGVITVTEPVVVDRDNAHFAVTSSATSAYKILPPERVGQKLFCSRAKVANSCSLLFNGKTVNIAGNTGFIIIATGAPALVELVAVDVAGVLMWRLKTATSNVTPFNVSPW